MSVSETGYDPLEVERAIDHAYNFAEDNPEFQESLEQAIEMVESMPYSVNEDETYTEEELVETVEGLNALENIQREIVKETGDRELADEVRDLEKYLEKTVLYPARAEGTLEI